MIGRGPRLSIRGEVGAPVDLGLPDLARLADAEVVTDLRCVEGWTRPGLRWRGVRLATLLALAGTTDDGRFVTVASGEFTVVLSRAQAADERVLIGLERDGAAPGAEPGAPRLVGPPDWDCFQSVKCIDRIELTRDPPAATAERIALGRLGRRAPARAARPGQER